MVWVHVARHIFISLEYLLTNWTRLFSLACFHACMLSYLRLSLAVRYIVKVITSAISTATSILFCSMVHVPVIVVASDLVQQEVIGCDREWVCAEFGDGHEVVVHLGHVLGEALLVHEGALNVVFLGKLGWEPGFSNFKLWK